MKIDETLKKFDNETIIPEVIKDNYKFNDNDEGSNSESKQEIINELNQHNFADSINHIKQINSEIKNSK